MVNVYRLASIPPGALTRLTRNDRRRYDDLLSYETHKRNLGNEVAVVCEGNELSFRPFFGMN